MSRLYLATLLWLVGTALVAAQDSLSGTPADLGLRIDKNKPLNVNADEFEAQRGEDDRDVFEFRRNVTATQEDLNLTCDWLQVRYATEGRQTERIEARGNVRLKQGANSVSCEEFVYDEPTCLAICKGNATPASVVRNGDTIDGRQIDLDLCSGNVKVRGNVRIMLRPATRPRSETPKP